MVLEALQFLMLFLGSVWFENHMEWNITVPFQRFNIMVQFLSCVWLEGWNDKNLIQFTSW